MPSQVAVSPDFCKQLAAAGAADQRIARLLRHARRLRVLYAALRPHNRTHLLPRIKFHLDEANALLEALGQPIWFLCMLVTGVTVPPEVVEANPLAMLFCQPPAWQKLIEFVCDVLDAPHLRIVEPTTTSRVAALDTRELIRRFQREAMAGPPPPDRPTTPSQPKAWPRQSRATLFYCSRGLR